MILPVRNADMIASAVQPAKQWKRTARSPTRIDRLAFPSACAGHRHMAKSPRSEEHTSELQSLMRISYAVFCLKKNKNNHIITTKLLSIYITHTNTLYHKPP